MHQAGVAHEIGDMNRIKAIGFDLFNTLITADPHALKDALGRLTGSLARAGIDPGYEEFKEAYREAALGFIKRANRTGRETHNRFWISEALGKIGYRIGPYDPRIGRAIDAYFSAFLDFCHPFPWTLEMLGTLRQRWPLGLLSNFTHAPAAFRIIDHLRLRPFFQVVLISGRTGFRKPHPAGFIRLVESLGVEGKEILYVGDDPEADINGALRAGLYPVRCIWGRGGKALLPPGAVSEEVEIEDKNVPEVSTWKELLRLLP